MVMELDGLNSDAVVRMQTWGLDLAGLNGQLNSLESAGGIGGLLAVDQAEVGGGTAAGGVDAVTYYFACDANGNIGQVIDWTKTTAGDAIVAHYDYDSYGNVVQVTGSYASENPWRFSTKWFDDETGLGYWGYRYYDPIVGRWLSRDPLEEDGGLLLYVYCGNSPMPCWDPLGMSWWRVPDFVLEPFVGLFNPNAFLRGTGGNCYTFLDCMGGAGRRCGASRESPGHCRWTGA